MVEVNNKIGQGAIVATNKPQIEAGNIVEEKPTYLTIDGTHIYNKVVAPVLPEELKTLTAGSAVEFHLARHFRALPESYKESLIGKEYKQYDPKDKIEKVITITADSFESALKVKGSKFDVNVPGLETPKKFIDFIQREAVKKAQMGELIWVDGGFCKKTYFTIELPQIIGRDQVVALEGLTSKQSASIEKQTRGKLLGDDFLVNYVKDHEGEPTNKIAVCIGHIKGEQAPEIFSAFPGKLAPEFPRDAQLEEQRNYNKKFWEEHAFIG